MRARLVCVCVCVRACVRVLAFVYLCIYVYGLVLEGWGGLTRGCRRRHTVLSSSLGALVGAHLRAAVQAAAPPLVLAWKWVTLGRFIVGVGVLLVTRAVVKAVALPAMTRIVTALRGGARPANPRADYGVEMPVKFATYLSVGLNAVYTVPILFVRLGLASE